MGDGAAAVRLARAARIVGIMALAIAGAVLLGWAVGSEALVRIAPGFAAMHPLTAAAVGLAGLALVLGAETVRRRWLSGAAAVAVVGLGGLRLVGFDHAVGRVAAHVAPLTALGLVLVGVGLVLAASGRARRLRDGLAFVVFALGIIVVTGYLYGANDLYGRGVFGSIALQSAAAFVVLGVGLALVPPGRGVLGVLFVPGPGRALALRLVPLTLVLPLGLGGLAIELVRRDALRVEHSLALVAGLAVTSFLAAVIGAANLVHRLARSRAAAQQELAEKLATLASVSDAILELNQAMQITAWNAGAERLTGIPASVALGKRPDELGLVNEDRAAIRAAVERDGRWSGPVVVTRPDGRVLATLCSFSRQLASGGESRIAAVIHDVTELREAEAAMRASQRQLEAANHELESFAYSVSHDLRAPLRAIDGFTQILRDEHRARLDPEGQRLLDVVVKNTGRMAEIIEDLLTLSRLGSETMHAEPTDMAALARIAADEARAAAPGRAIEVVIGPLPAAPCDPSLMRQVWSNLLVNAVKYTRPRPLAHIEVAGALEAGELVYRVKDNGVGFDPQHAGKLFHVFQRLHSASEFEGTGVGLALVDRVVKRHGGRVFAEGAIDRGATFGFVLPRGAA